MFRARGNVCARSASFPAISISDEDERHLRKTWADSVEVLDGCAKNYTSRIYSRNASRIWTWLQILTSRKIRPYTCGYWERILKKRKLHHFTFEKENGTCVLVRMYRKYGTVRVVYLPENHGTKMATVCFLLSVCLGLVKTQFGPLLNSSLAHIAMVPFLFTTNCSRVSRYLNNKFTVNCRYGWLCFKHNFPVTLSLRWIVRFDGGVHTGVAIIETGQATAGFVSIQIAYILFL